MTTPRSAFHAPPTAAALLPLSAPQSQPAEGSAPAGRAGRPSPTPPHQFASLPSLCTAQLKASAQQVTHLQDELAAAQADRERLQGLQGKLQAAEAAAQAAAAKEVSLQGQLEQLQLAMAQQEERAGEQVGRRGGGSSQGAGALRVVACAYPAECAAGIAMDSWS